MNTLLLLTVANIKSLARDRAALFWTFFFPVMFVLLFGVLFSGTGNSKVSVGFVDLDNTPTSAAVHQAFSGVSLLDIKVGSLDDEKAAMQHGDVSAVIVIPKGLQDTVTSAKSGQAASIAMQLYADPSKTQTTQVVQGVVAQIANGFNLQLAKGSEIVKIEQLTLSSTN